MLIGQIPNYENAVIYVPKGSISAYKNEWSHTANFQEVTSNVDLESLKRSDLSDRIFAIK